VKFSVVTPSFNQGRFIRDCIESVRMQSGVEVEHIVVDARSADETVAVLKEYPHLQWTSEPDKGMSDGINKGFLRATGEWMMWLNTDDYLLPGALQRVAAFVAGHPEADVIYGDADFVTSDKQFIRRKREHRFDPSVLLFYGCYIQSTATFIRRRVVDARHLLDINYRVCMDYEYYMRLARLGYVFRHLPESLAAFRWHDANTSVMQIRRRKEERLQVQREQLKLTNRPHILQNARVLDVLYRVYQLKRAVLRSYRS
jgi:glycosyltransferase involved in cell wall biosynthesis